MVDKTISVAELRLGEASWSDLHGVVHYAVGERSIPHVPETFLAYSLCGLHDIPANAAETIRDSNGRLTAPDAPTCKDCLAAVARIRGRHPPELERDSAREQARADA